VLVLVIIAGAIVLYRYQIRTSPRAGRKKPPAQAKLVQVIAVRKDDCSTMVIADGIVMPAQEVSLRPQVTGQIVELSADVVPGGIVKAGQNLMRIDHRDYEILVQQRIWHDAISRRRSTRLFGKSLSTLGPRSRSARTW